MPCSICRQTGHTKTTCPTWRGKLFRLDTFAVLPRQFTDRARKNMTESEARKAIRRIANRLSNILVPLQTDSDDWLARRGTKMTWNQHNTKHTLDDYKYHLDAFVSQKDTTTAFNLLEQAVGFRGLRNQMTLKAIAEFPREWIQVEEIVTGMRHEGETRLINILHFDAVEHVKYLEELKQKVLGIYRTISAYETGQLTMPRIHFTTANTIRWYRECLPHQMALVDVSPEEIATAQQAGVAEVDVILARDYAPRDSWGRMIRAQPAPAPVVCGVAEHLQSKCRERYGKTIYGMRVFEKTKCLICLDDIETDDLKTGKCGHEFCDGCVAGWVASKGKAECPTCKADY